jgi:hypothetical protein
MSDPEISMAYKRAGERKLLPNHLISQLQDTLKDTGSSLGACPGKV